MGKRECIKGGGASVGVAVAGRQDCTELRGEREEEKGWRGTGIGMGMYNVDKRLSLLSGEISAHSHLLTIDWIAVVM